jgi:hypothetical protein
MHQNPGETPVRKQAAQGRGERRRRWGVAAGLSAAVHAVLAVVLLWPHPAPGVREPQAIEVELVAPQRALTPVSRSGPPRRARPGRPAVETVAPSPLVVVPPSAVVPSAAPSPAEAAAAANLQRALRGAIGCGHAELLGLSAAEQQRCRDQQAQGLEPRPGQRGFGLDPRKRAAFAAEAREREPFLVQTPKDNCKPRVAQKDVGQGANATHDWIAGIGCAKSF